MGSIVSTARAPTTAMMMGVIRPFFGCVPSSVTPGIVVVIPPSLHLVETDPTNLLDGDPPSALLVFAIPHAGPHADVGLIGQQYVGMLDAAFLELIDRRRGGGGVIGVVGGGFARRSAFSGGATAARGGAAGAAATASAGWWRRRRGGDGTKRRGFPGTRRRHRYRFRRDDRSSSFGPSAEIIATRGRGRKIPIVVITAIFVVGIITGVFGSTRYVRSQSGGPSARGAAVAGAIASAAARRRSRTGMPRRTMRRMKGFDAARRRRRNGIELSSSSSSRGRHGSWPMAVSGMARRRRRAKGSLVVVST
mmetsp:Transcript_2018/g.4290  ORF Transcript_2018/g.4290 Transcript_2018/m.4290 type:complete len:307 (-) Transcript_2018:567-1487(-)